MEPERLKTVSFENAKPALGGKALKGRNMPAPGAARWKRTAQNSIFSKAQTRLLRQ